MPIHGFGSQSLEELEGRTIYTTTTRFYGKPMITEQTGTVALAITTAGSLLTLVVQQFFAERNADRRAKEARAQTEADIAAKKADTENLAAKLALATASQHSVVLAKIAENTDLTLQAKTEAHAAFAVANSVNEKIAAVGLQVANGETLKP